MQTDVAVVGAGVVGLAIARAFAERGHAVAVFERHAGVARENSSRNSGVIHSGLYYPTGSSKARLCVRGRRQLVAYARRHGVPYVPCGKLIVARDEAELPELAELAERARTNDAGEAHLLSRSALRTREPLIDGAGALWVSETGVVRTQSLVQAFVRELEALGGQVHIGMEVRSVDHVAQSMVLGFDGEVRVRARVVVNAGGLDADRLLTAMGVDVAAEGLEHRACRGTYAVLPDRLRKAVQHLVYPLPERAGGGVGALGVHLTRDVDGYLSVGPDSEWLERDGDVLGLDTTRLRGLYEGASRWLAGLREDELVLSQCGVRPRLHGPGDDAADFVLRRGDAWGLPRFVTLAGIESPGLTACMALADEVTRVLEHP